MGMETFNQCEAYNSIRWMSHGNDCQQFFYNYNGIVIVERTVFFWNYLKPPSTWYTIDVLLPIDSKEKIEAAGGIAIDSDELYAEEGHLFAKFKDVEKMIVFIDNILPTLIQKT